MFNELIPPFSILHPLCFFWAKPPLSPDRADCGGGGSREDPTPHRGAIHRHPRAAATGGNRARAGEGISRSASSCGGWVESQETGPKRGTKQEE